ncbi:hypothetical protein [Chamaesiphon minutus]|uniref:PEP-CTERM exosortase interaction domain-containing protein n=1 Tax=Chamaesiphon minutus (strain ATCC 27169 / PCC 6605) TaxID=1173020 RepID=K9UBG8_CHAP6|nr:hypothetical protein [Chamaesiphon minutus]AFY91569.1 hypothetical protein Cha6605_0268 [Chamaesiphon minutus PCC 6605]
MKRITTVGVLQLSIATAASAISLAGTAPIARSATLTQVFSAAALGANDIVDWSSPTLTVGPTNLTINSTGGLTVAGTQNGGGARILPQSLTGFLVAAGNSNALQDPTNPATQNGLWNGNFAPNTSVFYSNGNLGGLTLSFSTPVAAIGAQINSLFYRNSTGTPGFQGTLTAFATDNTSQTFNFPGVTNGNADNSAAFWGVSSNTANISSIVFRSFDTPTSGPFDADNFALGSVLIANPAATAVPEPFTIVGTMIGAASAWKMRKRLKATNKI